MVIEGKKPEGAWALAKLEILNDTTLTEDERNILTTCTINNVIDEINSLDHEHAIHSTSRKVMGFFQPVFSLVDKYGKAMDVLSQADPQGILTLTWGSIRILLAVAKSFYKYFDDLVAFLGDIVRPITRLQAYGELVPKSESLQTCLRNVFVDFLRFMHKTRRMFIDKTNYSKAPWRTSVTVFRRNTWKDYSKEVAEEIAHITRLCNDAQHEAELAVAQTTIGNQTESEANAAERRRDAEEAFSRQDEASKRIVRNQILQAQASAAAYDLAHTESQAAEEGRRRADEAFAAIKAEQQRVQEKEEEQEKVTEANLMREICEWLNPVDAMEDFRSLRQQRLQGTCDWILKNSTFSDWIKNPIGETQPNMLWINAIAGAGKTIICTRIVEHLQESGQSVAVFYCDTKDDRKRRTENILRSWSYQLLLQAPTKLRNVAELYRSGKQSNVEMFTNAVKTFLGGDEERFMVLDALDECEMPVRMQIFQVLQQFKTAKIMITSRREKDIIGTMAGYGSAVATINIESGDNARDIKLYLDQKIKAMELNDKELEYRLAKELFEEAHGMFLYARLVIEDLKKRETLADIEDALDNLPKGLPAIYDRVLSRIDRFDRESKKENARLLLNWICGASEPLTVDQIKPITAFNLDKDEDEMNPRRSLRSVEEFIYECCGPLVEIGIHDSKIRISHATVKEHLISRARTGDATYFVDLDEAHHILARSCLALLSYTNIEIVDVDSDHDESLAKLEAHLEATPILSYAIVHWWRHTLHSARPMDAKLQRAFRKFAANNRHGVKWLQMFQYMRGDRTAHWHPGFNEHLKVLPYLIQLKDAWKEVADEPTWLDEIDDKKRYMRFYCLLTCYSMHYYPAIAIAALFNYPDVIEQELARGISTEVTNWLGESPIMLGARGNSVEAVAVLLKHAANPSHIGDQTENALHRATSWAGKIEEHVVRNIAYDTVPLLLAAGADLHMRNFAGDTQTHYICGHAYELPSVVELLGWVLDAGGKDDIEARNNRQQTPLVMAAGNGLKACSQLLLDAGADPDGGIDATTKFAFTPLNQAAKKDDPTIGLMLIDAGARIDVANPENHHTSLIEAVIRDSRLVEALLHAKADPNISDKKGLFPIHHAAIEDSIKAIPILLKHGARLDVRDAEGKTALDLAVENGRANSVKILTEAGAIRAIADAPQSTSVETVGTIYPQTEHDTIHMYSLLKQQTRGQIHHAGLVRILDTAEYWIKTTVEREEFMIVTHDDEDGSNGFLPYIISLPITGANQFPVQKLVISTRSHDQGWSSYPQHRKSYDHSWTGFRLRVQRTPQSAQNWIAHLQKEGKNEKEIREIMAKEEHHVQSNRHGWPEEKLHINVWSRNDSHDVLIKSLQKGDILEVVPWALYPGWQNHIVAAKLEIYTACFVSE